MTDEVTIYHNPRCSKSRQTLALLEERGVTPIIIEYLSESLNTALLKDLLHKLGLEPRALMRKREPSYAENNLANTDLTEIQLLEAMVANPILIERPIVVKGSKAVIGRPPENIAALF